MALTDALEKVKSNLNKNGFPASAVAFPSAQLASFCHKQDISLSALLSALEEEGIKHSFAGERVCFTAAAAAAQNGGARQPMDILRDLAADLDLSALQSTMAAHPDKKPSFFELMKALGPGKIKELSQKIAALSPEERQSVMDMAKNLGFTPPLGG